MKNACCRTVVALKLYNLGSRKLFWESKNIFYLGSAELIDRLIIITYYADVSAAFLVFSVARKTLQQAVLCDI